MPCTLAIVLSTTTGRYRQFPVWSVFCSSHRIWLYMCVQIIISSSYSAYAYPRHTTVTASAHGCRLSLLLIKLRYYIVCTVIMVHVYRYHQEVTHRTYTIRQKWTLRRSPTTRTAKLIWKLMEHSVNIAWDFAQ